MLSDAESRGRGAVEGEEAAAWRLLALQGAEAAARQQCYAVQRTFLNNTVQMQQFKWRHLVRTKAAKAPAASPGDSPDAPGPPETGRAKPRCRQACSVEEIAALLSRVHAKSAGRQGSPPQTGTVHNPYSFTGPSAVPLIPKPPAAPLDPSALTAAGFSASRRPSVESESPNLVLRVGSTGSVASSSGGSLPGDTEPPPGPPTLAALLPRPTVPLPPHPPEPVTPVGWVGSVPISVTRRDIYCRASKSSMSKILQGYQAAAPSERSLPRSHVPALPAAPHEPAPWPSGPAPPDAPANQPPLSPSLPHSPGSDAPGAAV